ncbi:phage late gene regulator [Klebsiella variicola]|nr:phage late gene regulator [Klebsiella variicola]VGA96526.1 phage late gene regulator [Klebsiella variicola]
MMHCPFCKKSAHARTSRYLSENVKQRYHQCTNIECSATFHTIEAIDDGYLAPGGENTACRGAGHTPGTPQDAGLLQLAIPSLIRGELTMTTLTLQQAFEASQNNKTA